MVALSRAFNTSFAAVIWGHERLHSNAGPGRYGRGPAPEAALGGWWSVALPAVDDQRYAGRMTATGSVFPRLNCHRDAVGVDHC